MKSRFLIITMFAVMSLFAMPESVFGQVYKLKATSTQTRTKKENGKWTQWSSKVKANMLITIDSDKERITIYTEPKKVYDVIKNKGESFSKNGNEIQALGCVDRYGKNCTVRLLQVKNTNNFQVYVDYSNKTYVYNVYKL